MDFAYIVAGYYLLFCAAAAGLILRLMRNCPLDDEEEEFSMLPTAGMPELAIRSRQSLGGTLSRNDARNEK